MELKGKKINFLGDSITEGVGISNPENHYFDYLKRSCELDTVRNYGISGTRIARQSGVSGLDRFDWDFCLRAPEMDDDADIIVVFGGTNDYGHGNAPIGTMDDRTPDTFYGALHTLITELIDKYTEKTIVFMTPLHRCNEGSLRGDGSKKEDGLPLKAYVDIIREVTEYYSIPTLDLYSMSGIQPNVESNRIAYCPDGLHPNDKGHELIAKRLEGFLKAL